MSIVRLGSNVLRWCDSCNLPILELKNCLSCGSHTKEIPITPPGDCRPAFAHDIKHIRKIADSQFGQGCGNLLLPDGHIVLLNRCPSLDKMEEIIFDGQVLGSIIFDPPFGEKIIIRPPAAARMQEKMRKSLVKADDGALPSIRKSSNLMGPGVLEASSELEAGSEVAVTDEGGTVVATGIAKKSGTEMMERGKGVAVKIRWVAEERDGRQKKKNDWDMVVRVNSDHIEKKVQIAKNFIIDLERKYRKPIAVSFSGGKDSLVTLHLALEAGVRPDILFANTGLELEETVSEIQRVAEETGLRLLWEDAGEAFWDNLDYFGPPGKDFRWCCKICKLGPTTRLICSSPT